MEAKMSKLILFVKQNIAWLIPISVVGITALSQTWTYAYQVGQCRAYQVPIEPIVVNWAILVPIATLICLIIVPLTAWHLYIVHPSKDKEWEGKKIYRIILSVISSPLILGASAFISFQECSKVGEIFEFTTLIIIALITSLLVVSFFKASIRPKIIVLILILTPLLGCALGYVQGEYRAESRSRYIVIKNFDGDLQKGYVLLFLGEKAILRSFIDSRTTDKIIPIISDPSTYYTFETIDEVTKKRLLKR